MDTMRDRHLGSTHDRPTERAPRHSPERRRAPGELSNVVLSDVLSAQRRACCREHLRVPDELLTSTV